MSRAPYVHIAVLGAFDNERLCGVAGRKTLESNLTADITCPSCAAIYEARAKDHYAKEQKLAKLKELAAASQAAKPNVVTLADPLLAPTPDSEAREAIRERLGGRQ